jgi:glycosyltransferase involved in cell wall biosynthesis
MKPRILIILEAGEVIPSGVVRGTIYRDYFRQNGFEIKYLSRTFPPLASLLMTPPRWLRPLMAAGLWRVFSIVSIGVSRLLETYIIHVAKHYEVIYTSKVLKFSFFEKLRRHTKARLVLDFGDSVWLPQFGIRQLGETLQLADAVTTDNDRTAAYIRQFNPNCTVIPDCPQVELFDRQRDHLKNTSEKEKIILGWIGTPGSAFNLFVVWEALERLFVRHENLHLRLVGTELKGNLPQFEKVECSCRPRYDQAGMIEEVLAMDIGLFPLFDVEASRVRGILKATVYMAGEAVVVGSPVGQSAELIQDGVNGLLAASSEEWEKKLDMLITNAPYRRRISQAALQKVRRDFTIARSFEKLVSVLSPIS